MQLSSIKKKPALWRKQFPTIVGLGVLVLAMIAGLLFFKNGTGVFSPRATPQTTPKNVRISNVNDKGFTVSFITDDKTLGIVKYGTSENKLDKRASDDRDQLSGSVAVYSLHHLTIRDLIPNTTYYFVISTGRSEEFDNNGQAFNVTTGSEITSVAPASKTVYGNVKNSGGTPAEGAVVYISSSGVGLMSTMVKASGSWGLPLAQARNADGKNYAKINDETMLAIIVQGDTVSQISQFSVAVKESQPVAEVVLGTGTIAIQESAITPTISPAEIVEALPSETISMPVLTITPIISVTPSPGNFISPSVVNPFDNQNSTISGVLDLANISPSVQPVLVEQPVIRGQAPPTTSVNISIHSDNNIQQTVTTDSNGNFEIDLSSLKETLEPGEHTITYDYIDSNTGQKITKTQTFTVAAKAGAIKPVLDNPSGSLANSKQIPYGSGNPYPLEETDLNTEIEPQPSQAVSTKSASSSKKKLVATRSALVSTNSGVMRSGSVGITGLLIVGGLFLIATGWWSWWLARQFQLRDS